MMALVPKLLLAVACGISAVSAQSVTDFDNYRGAIDCVNQRTKVGSTDGFDSVLDRGFGNRGPDHYWSFNLSQETDVTFDSCPDLDFTPIITVYTYASFVVESSDAVRGLVQAHGSASRKCDGTPSTTSERPVWANRLSAGAYWVNLEGFTPNEAGDYSMTTSCVAAPTAPPTPPPTPPPTTAPPTTAPPTPQPTGGPTRAFIVLRTDPPTTPPPINGPPYVLTPDGGYCPPGYGEYTWLNDPNRRPLRFNEPRGRIVIRTSHVECAARCTNYSHPGRYMGGCKSYMTGMYYGMLFCRTYGGGSLNNGPAPNPKFTTPCASFASPVNRGFGSGQIGDTHANTNQINVGGHCCSSTSFLIRETPPATTQVGYDQVLLLGDANDDTVSSSSSSNDTSASASNVWLGIAITVGVVLLLYVAYNVGSGNSGRGRYAVKGDRGPTGNADATR